jgi:hypothetical protein
MTVAAASSTRPEPILRPSSGRCPNIDEGNATCDQALWFGFDLVEIKVLADADLLDDLRQDSTGLGDCVLGIADFLVIGVRESGSTPVNVESALDF